MLTALDKHTQLQSLRNLIGTHQPAFVQGYTHADLSVPIPKGAVVEILGSARHEFVASFLAKQAKACLWVQKELSFFPTALLQRGLQTQGNVYVEAGDNVQWVLRQALQSQVFPFIVGEDFFLNEKDLRKIQLLAERSGTSFLHLCSDYRPSWVPMLSLNVERRLSVDGELSFSHQVLRRRGGL